MLNRIANKLIALFVSVETIFEKYQRSSLSPLSEYQIFETLFYTLSKCPGEMHPGVFPGQEIGCNFLPGSKLCLLDQYMNNFSTSLIKRFYPPPYLEKLVAPT